MYLMKLFLDKTDDTHSITMVDILSYLEKCGISAERKSIYDDIETLRLYGIDIEGHKEKGTFYYHVANRQFELAELKLLVDAVQSSKFITAKKSNQLIRKIESFASLYEASQLQRQVYVAERIKTMNESIYYNVDKIHTAINTNSKISYKYFEWTINKQMNLRKDGERYVISPWALSWNDENYYMIGFDSVSSKIKHYRVDKMLDIDITEEKRDGKEHFEKFDMALYAKKMFGMYGGQEESVRIEFDNSLIGVVIDRFGKDIIVIPKDEEYFTVCIDVAVSRQFFAWVFGLGSGAKIVSPDGVVKQIREEAERLVEQYR